ncbi:MAG: winged helix-turn-helix transcriptional regulator [Dehalococcoidia bacterium]|nr:winged helix-turn-helix transcriptional regulator [Dehalococcoidia bacterium]
MSSIEDQANLFGILADPTRLKLLRLLSQQQASRALCVNALASQLGVSQSAISQHLRVLKSADLVKGERRGYRIHYFLNKAALVQAQKQISGVLPFRDREIDGKGAGGAR